MSRARTVVLIAALLGGSAALSLALWKFRPVAPKAPPIRILPVVEFETIERRDYQIYVVSQGIVEAVMESTLAAEVSGRISKVYPIFLPGERFAAGDPLLEIDTSDYEAALAQAKATLEDARLALKTEQARGEQARRDWEKLGRGGPASDLVLRTPHQESAAARVAAAEAAVSKAARDLERCELRAPYAGRIVAKHTGLGAYVNEGAPLADVYATEVLEVRLPVSLDEFLSLHTPSAESGPAVELSAQAGGNEFRWRATIVRSEATVDRSSRSVRLVARIPPPPPGDDTHDLLRPGLFIRARIQGVALPGAIRIPRRALRNDNQVILIDGDNRLRFQDVAVRWRDPDEVVVSEGLKEGDRICVTFLADVTEAMLVEAVPAPASPGAPRS